MPSNNLLETLDEMILSVKLSGRLPKPDVLGCFFYAAIKSAYMDGMTAHEINNVYREAVSYIRADGKKGL